MHNQSIRVMASRDKELDLTHKLEPETPLEVVRHVTNVQDTMSFSEPLPSASELAEYEKVQPGAADRIISIIEKGQSLESDALQEKAALAKHRLTASTIMSLSLIATAVAALIFGPGWLSIPLGFGGILAFALRELLNRDIGRRNGNV
ncbi:MAG: DUF2335 domain-containing protein [Rhodothermaceae bacterium]|nr:DUF2335 domain-containing protein [Rhodothermaceae bacterium]MXZ58608.1 DUF2335 domain-containing protein [Rhodothermaceae bacterium]MYB91029.1 DUF2335 domain-containing protein [Rhodothermaceae bacterium]MYD66921.1 DUF2335 domain-containing protein [Rhodothermaceae bacterium]MYG44824.1 DUF2335 domain-containing protein [Rhodothermaceae bacterium]